MLTSIASASITLTGLVFSVTMLVLQLTGSQYSPRAVGALIGDRNSRYTLGESVGTFTYSLAVLRTKLAGYVTLGGERNMVGDPLYGSRQLVDIADRALSPGTNDPTTAVQAIDQVHHLLRRIVRRPIPNGKSVAPPDRVGPMVDKLVMVEHDRP